MSHHVTGVDLQEVNVAVGEGPPGSRPAPRDDGITRSEYCMHLDVPVRQLLPCFSRALPGGPKPTVRFPRVGHELAHVVVLGVVKGRNPDLLIGRHVEAAPSIARLDLETVPTGYMLIGDPPLTAAAYMSHSLPIPLSKPDLAVATALAGEMLGLRCLYLDAGSGAGTPIPAQTIRAITEAVSLPLIVGGGLSCQEDLERAWDAGATCAVIGSAVEQEPAVLDALKLRV